MENEIPPQSNMEDENEKGLQVWRQEEVVVTRTKTVKRLSFKNIIGELFQLLNIDRGLIFTAKGLTIHPAKTIKAYLDTDRDIITSPIKYFFIILGLTLFVAIQTGFFNYNLDERVKGELPEHIESKEQQKEVVKTLEDGKYFYDKYILPYQNFFTALIVFFMSILSFYAFRKSGYNFIENLAINTYIFSHTTLLVILIMLFNLKAIYWWRIYQFCSIVMTVSVYHYLFNQSLVKTIFKSLFILAISFFLYLISMVSAITVYLRLIE